jgi:hypothetical protein
MSHSDEDKELFDQEFQYMVDSGLIEVVGINNDGEWLYQATEAGKKLYEAVIDTGLVDSLQWWLEKEED